MDLPKLEFWSEDAPRWRRVAGAFNRWRGRLVESRLGGAWLLLFLAITMGSGTRLVLLLSTLQSISCDYTLLALLGWGLIFDLAASLLLLTPVAILLAVPPQRFFRGAIGRACGHTLMILCVYGLLFGAVSEWFFWQEFGTRFNFIAVDYLVYTTEVIGNIRESYPVPWILLGLGGAAASLYLSMKMAGSVASWLDHSEQSAAPRWGGSNALDGGSNSGRIAAFGRTPAGLRQQLPPGTRQEWSLVLRRRLPVQSA